MSSPVPSAVPPPQPPPTTSSTVELRPLASAADFTAAVGLQLDTWGAGFAEAVPGSVLKICQKVGGVAAGAFDVSASGRGRILGFVFGLTGVRHGRLAHWSHMLAVAPEARDLGLGTRLKLFQRDLLLPLGVESIYWTYDPLEARNAHLNFNRLGVEVEEYVRDMYADEMGSELAQGIGTDRFIVDWRIGEARGPGGPPAFDPAAPVVGLEAARLEAAGDAELPEGPRVQVEIPASIQDLKRERPEEAAAWRAATRRAFETYLGRGYRVAGFGRAATGRCFYDLARG
jgi:predicted GNAT superfamily acetyltransferase